MRAPVRRIYGFPRGAEGFIERLGRALAARAGSFAARPVMYRLGTSGAGPAELRRLELEAVRRTRAAGYVHLHVMLPHARSVWELEPRCAVLAESGLLAQRGFELWARTEDLHRIAFRARTLGSKTALTVAAAEAEHAHEVHAGPVPCA